MAGEPSSLYATGVSSSDPGAAEKRDRFALAGFQRLACRCPGERGSLSETLGNVERVST